LTRRVWQADQKAGRRDFLKQAGNAGRRDFRKKDGGADRRDFLKKAERTGRSCFASKGKKKKKGTDYGQEGTQAGGE